MEQQAKERLTGGVILVVLLVLLVPELLTGPRPLPAPAPVQPDQAPMRSYTMDLGESPHVHEPVAASTAAAPAREPAVSATSAPAAAPGQPPTLSASSQPPTASTPPARAPAPTTAEHGAGGWTVQVGTFSSRDNAARLVATLKSHGFSPTLSEATKNGHKLFRVRVGGDRDRAAAQKLLARLKNAGQKAGEIVPTSSTISAAVPAARRP